MAPERRFVDLPRFTLPAAAMQEQTTAAGAPALSHPARGSRLLLGPGLAPRAQRAWTLSRAELWDAVNGYLDLHDVCARKQRSV